MKQKQLLKEEHYSFIFDELKNKKCFICHPLGNLGDILILEATLQLFKFFNINYNVVHLGDKNDLSSYDAVLWPGGGNMGTLYKNNYIKRKIISQEAEKQNIPFIILPSSWTSEDDVSAYKFYSREKESIRLYAESALFAPDFALAYKTDLDVKKINKIGKFFRKDTESKVNPVDNFGDPLSFCKNLEQYITLAGSYEEIHTDRLHFSICGLMMGTRVYLYPNSYHKNKAMYYSWLSKYTDCTFIA